MHPSLTMALLAEARELRAAESLLWQAWSLAKLSNNHPADKILEACNATYERRRGLIIRAWEGRKQP